MSILSNDEQFWAHERNCDTCYQHPQSVTSFHYNPLCRIGRALAISMGMFKGYEPPEYDGENFSVQDAFGHDIRTCPSG